MVNEMKYTGYKDTNGSQIYTEDTLFSPEFGEFKVKYHDDLGGLIICQASQSDGEYSFEYETIHEISYLHGHSFYVVGRGNDSRAEINKKVVAIISRQSITA